MSTTENQGNTYELPLEAFLARINRHLKRLIPYRELFYDFGRRNYFIRVVNQGQPNHLLPIFSPHVAFGRQQLPSEVIHW